MKAGRIGSLEYYLVGDGSRAMLSVGKMHGDEPHSYKGVASALEVIDKMQGLVSYIAIPEVNPSYVREYEGVDINRDFGNFWSGKSRDMCGIVNDYKPVMIVDHHDNNYRGDGFFTIIPASKNNEGLEHVLAKKLVEHVCYEEDLFTPLSNDMSMAADWAIIRKIDTGVYQLNLNSTLTGYFKKGVLIEVPSMDMYHRAVSEVHKECDLFLKEELERLVRESRI